ncbi:hypothetical protein B0H13DRAFT_2519132 [Mycena leptocephala]|nr:hypothetical protein B0H13DRAFT_2519132 [Mycena leptocephala]
MTLTSPLSGGPVLSTLAAVPRCGARADDAVQAPRFGRTRTSSLQRTPRSGECVSGRPWLDRPLSYFDLDRMRGQGCGQGSLFHLDLDPTLALSPSSSFTPHLTTAPLASSRAQTPHPPHRPLRTHASLRAHPCRDGRRNGWVRESERLRWGVAGVRVCNRERGEEKEEVPSIERHDMTTTYNTYTRIPTKSAHIGHTHRHLFGLATPKPMPARLSNIGPRRLHLHRHTYCRRGLDLDDSISPRRRHRPFSPRSNLSLQSPSLSSIYYCLHSDSDSYGLKYKYLRICLDTPETRMLTFLPSFPLTPRLPISRLGRREGQWEESSGRKERYDEKGKSYASINIGLPLDPREALLGINENKHEKEIKKGKKREDFRELRRAQ